ncbi:MAG: OmpA family protein [Pirellulales bacterium]
MQHLRSFAALSAALLLVASPLVAQDNWGRGGVELGVSYGVLNGIGDEFLDLDPVALDIDNNHFFAGRLGYVLKAGLGVEGFFGYMSNDLQTPGVGAVDVTVLNYGGDLVWNLQPESALQIFFMGGGGQQRIEASPADEDSETESFFAWNYGAGVKMFLSRHVAFRVDWRNYIAPTGPERLRGLLNDGVVLEDEGLSSTEWTAGISLFVGGPADEDGDGVRDADDLCLGTPDGVAVDGDGCPFDDDGDGVYNYTDSCPDTPAGALVDGTGCPTDADGDEVFDGLDQCADTPNGAVVDDNGCPTDEDGDGVFNGLDQCLGTPAGAVVDGTGCPTDSDSDGVFDGIDKCPGTPAGREVDADGCGEFEAALAEGRLVLAGVQFEFNSSDIKDESKADLDRAAAAIRNSIANRPGISIEVQGHSDAIGSESYNQSLSERRAAAVRDYVASVGPSIAGALTTRGYGESQPIADNDTDEGRAQNRRVEFVVTGDD